MDMSLVSLTFSSIVLAIQCINLLSRQNELTYNGRLLINAINNSGSKILPCGTPWRLGIEGGKNYL
jgi:hypothetical protein